MRFKWLNKAAEQSVVTMAYARVKMTGLPIEQAVTETIAKCSHCRNPEAMTDERFHRICKAVEENMMHSGRLQIKRKGERAIEAG